MQMTIMYFVSGTNIDELEVLANEWMTAKCLVSTNELELNTHTNNKNNNIVCHI